MSVRIDHAASALGHMANAVKVANSGGRESARIELQMAQIDALLAQVEQMRIANLIALAGLPDINGFENETHDAATEALMAGLLGSRTVPAVAGYGLAGGFEHVFIRSEIREALGLS
ncbi:hypothetical protein [Microbacterium sp. YY-01]|uniref:hypothetical protein n=1 Tax=Microbacterium sp. YY-01 TaxID=3421634 RepID=UPI003D173522